MFNKIQSVNKQSMAGKNPSSSNPERDKEIFEKISRIQESYVDAAIRSVKRKFSGRRSPGFEG